MKKLKYFFYQNRKNFEFDRFFFKTTKEDFVGNINISRIILKNSN
jgi:hypothetical protein